MLTTIRGRNIEHIIVDDIENWDQLPYVAPEWYDKPEDRVFALMGIHPGPMAKYTIPPDEIQKDTQGYLMTWEQRYGRWLKGERD